MSERRFRFTEQSTGGCVSWGCVSCDCVSCGCVSYYVYGCVLLGVSLSVLWCLQCFPAIAGSFQWFLVVFNSSRGFSVVLNGFQYFRSTQ